MQNLRGYWLKKPEIGLKRLIVITLAFFLLLLTTLKAGYCCLNIFLIIYLILIILLVKNYYRYGYFHRLSSWGKSKNRIEIVDYVNPSKPKRNKRVMRCVSTGNIWSKAYLSQEQNGKELLCLSIVYNVFKKKLIKIKNPKFLWLGGGGFAIPLFFSNKYPLSRNVVVEVSREVVKNAIKFFFPLYSSTKPANIHIVIKDARSYMTITADKFDFIFQDISNEAVVLNEFLTTLWIKQVLKRLKPKGLLLINLGWQINAELTDTIISLVSGRVAPNTQFRFFDDHKNLLLLIQKKGYRFS